MASNFLLSSIPLDDLIDINRYVSRAVSFSGQRPLRRSVGGALVNPANDREPAHPAVIAAASRAELLSVAGAMLVGTAALMILGIQPVLLGALTEEHRLSVVALGRLAMVENLALAASSAVGVRLMVGRGIRVRTAAICLALALTDFAVYLADSTLSLYGLRAVAGLLEGLMLGATVRVLIYAQHPDRVNAVFLAVQTVPQMLAAYLLPVFLVPRWGSNVGFALLGMLGLISVGGARYFLAPVPTLTRPAPATPLTAGSTLGLLAVVVQSAGIGGAWSYFEQVGAEHAFDAHTIGLAVSASLAFQIGGAFFVAWVGWRAPARIVLPIGIVIQAGIVLGVTRTTDPAWYTAAACAFGLLWLGLQPYQVRQLIRLDPSRRIALLILPLTLAGLSLGPLAVSSFVEGEHVSAAVRIAAVLLLVGAALFEATNWLVRAPDPARARNDIEVTSNEAY